MRTEQTVRSARNTYAISDNGQEVVKNLESH